MSDNITTLRAAADAMARDGHVIAAAHLILEADLAEAFNGNVYDLGPPDPRMVEAAHEYQEGA